MDGYPLEPRAHHQAGAWATRRDIERTLDLLGWPWSAAVSLWLDALLLEEEADR
jgi:hypothetical protein